MGFVKKIRFLLIPFSFIYLAVTSLRNFFYNSRIFRENKLDARVISVGNVTWGGTGKTPAVMFIAGLLLERGHKPAILTRGYGGDEQKLFSRLAPGVPVKVGKDRVKSGSDAIGSGSVRVLLLDDGFQYRRLKRDLDIVCIDAANPFGNGWVIPVGEMREGMSCLKRADIFLLTKVDLAKDIKILEERLKGINLGALIVKSIHQARCFYKLSNEQLVDAGILKDKNLVLVSAIGDPGSFERTVSGLGLKFKKHFIFRDHHWYTEKDFKKIENYCIKNGIETVVTTEKDAVRFRTTDLGLRTEIVVLHIELRIIENEQRFYDRLFGIHSG